MIHTNSFTKFDFFKMHNFFFKELHKGKHPSVPFKVVPQIDERYIPSTDSPLRFTDSMNFMRMSFGTIVEALDLRDLIQTNFL